MSDEVKEEGKKEKSCCEEVSAEIKNACKPGASKSGSNASNAVYGLGFLGAAIYFIQHAGSFWAGVLGIVKAIFWPIIVIYKLLELFKM